MNQIKTAVIIGIITVVMLGIIIFLNRDKFSNKTTESNSSNNEDGNA